MFVQNLVLHIKNRTGEGIHSSSNAEVHQIDGSVCKIALNTPKKTCEREYIQS